MTKFDKVATSHNCNFRRGGVPLREQFTETANESYHVYNLIKVIIVLHIYDYILASD